MEIQQAFQDWFTTLVKLLPKLISGIVIFIFTIVVSGFLAKWVKQLAKKRIENIEILHLIFLLTRWSVLILGTIFALSQVDFDLTGFIAGLGVAGFTIGFALQDIAKNFISGILLLSRQPFNIGDHVKVNDYSGRVKEINVRDNALKHLMARPLLFPISQCSKTPSLTTPNPDCAGVQL